MWIDRSGRGGGRVWIERSGRAGGSGDRQEWGGGRGRVGTDTEEWGERGSVDRHEWEGRRRAGTDSGVGGGESGDR